MKKSILLITIIFTISIYSQAQLEEFKLSDYKLPDIKRHQLDFDLNLFTSATSGNNQIDQNSYDYFLTRGTFIPKYSFYRNSKRYQAEINADMDIGYGFQKEKEVLDSAYYTEKKSSNGYDANIYVFAINRIYWKSLFYSEFNLNTDMRINGSHYSDSEEYQDSISSEIHKYDSRFQKYIFEIPLKIGYGRIEQIQDARQAIFILQDLYEKDRLERIPSNDEIIKFSEQISKVKNKRYFDSRLQKIDELDSTNAFLINNGLISKDDIVYFSSLNDMWDFGGLPIRQSGFRIAFGVDPFIGYTNRFSKSYLNSTNVTNEYNNTDQTIALLSNITADYFKPIKQKWQYNIEAKLGLGPMHLITKESSFNNPEGVEIEFDLMKYFTKLKTSIGFYPNTRTYMELIVDGYICHDKGKKNFTNNPQEFNGIFLTLQPEIQAYYYISPKFRIQFFYRIFLQYFKGENTIYPLIYPYQFDVYGIGSNIYSGGENHSRGFGQDIGVAFTYSIF